MDKHDKCNVYDIFYLFIEEPVRNEESEHSCKCWINIIENKYYIILQLSYQYTGWRYMLMIFSICLAKSLYQIRRVVCMFMYILYIVCVLLGIHFASVSTHLQLDFGSSDLVVFFLQKCTFDFFLKFDCICYSLHECLKSFSYDNGAEIFANPSTLKQVLDTSILFAEDSPFFYKKNNKGCVNVTYDFFVGTHNFFYPTRISVHKKKWSSDLDNLFNKFCLKCPCS